MLVLRAKRANRAMLASPPASGLRDHDGAAAEADQPVRLAGVVALDRGLLLANIERALRDQHGISFQAIGAVETHTPALQAFEEPLQGSSVTTAQLPVEEPSRIAIQPETGEPSASPALSAAHTSPAAPSPLRPSSPAEQPGAAEPVGLTASDPERVDINAASAEDLNRLGGRFAKAIIASRPYGSVDDLTTHQNFLHPGSLM